MARKFNKRSTRMSRKPAARRRTQVYTKTGGGSKSMPFDASKPAKRRFGFLRGSKMVPRKRSNASVGELSPALMSANIRYSKGLSVGKYKKPTFSQRVLNVSKPPTSLNQKWSFQMDCSSGRVTAAEIPLLTYPLLVPIINQMNVNALTDTAFQPGTFATTNPQNNQYNFQIASYTSKLKFYNSSTNTLRARVVWYTPKNNMPSAYEGFGTNTSNPLNMLMIASNSAAEYGLGVSPGNGTFFDNVTPGSNYQNNYSHAGWPLTGLLTTAASAANVVAYLDPSLVPGSPQVRRMFNSFWKTLKSEDFTLAPGNQFNTSVTLKNKIMSNFYDDFTVQHRKNTTVIGIVYVLGQIVFSDGSAGPEAGTAITTGSSQLSIMREDNCLLMPLITKRTVRVSLTAPNVVLANAEQGIINNQTNNEDIEYFQEF